MTIDSLIELLEGHREELGGETEVRLMTQEDWPFENDIRGVASRREIDACSDEEDDEDEEESTSTKDDVVFIVEGGQRCYGTKLAWEAARNS